MIARSVGMSLSTLLDPPGGRGIRDGEGVGKEWPEPMASWAPETDYL